jgi:hypothetical protein
MIQNENEYVSRISGISIRLCIFCSILFLCLGTGIYIIEHLEEREYAETSCYVRTSGVESFLCSRRRYYICYYPVWEVEYNNNGTKDATITERRKDMLETYSVASNRREQFQVSRKTDRGTLNWYLSSIVKTNILLI